MSIIRDIPNPIIGPVISPVTGVDNNDAPALNWILEYGVWDANGVWTSDGIWKDPA